VIVSVINNKGGTAKTTTCVSLAGAMAAAGCRTLLVDLDAQASASLSLGVSSDDLSPSIADILFTGRPVAETIRSTGVAGLDLVTANMDLANADLLLSDRKGRERQLAHVLRPLKAEYDVILIDCPPALSLLPVNALVAADGCIVCVSPDYLAFEGFMAFTRAVARIRRGIGADVTLLGIALTMVIPGLKVTRQLTESLRQRYGQLVFETEIRRDVKLAEAPGSGKTIFEYAPTSNGAVAYRALCAEVLTRCGIRTSAADVTQAIPSAKGDHHD
jgi:chromosome partitioning protein